MSHLWVKEAAGGWEAQKLTVGPLDLPSLSALRAGDTASALGPGTVHLVRAEGGKVWALVAGPQAHVRVNGRAPVAGITVLADRDEIRAQGDLQYFFSSESLAIVEPFPAQERPVFCARCRQPIVVGAPAVRCPGAACNLWYHQSADLPCYTYAETCAFCGRRTALDTGFSWVPEA